MPFHPLPEAARRLFGRRACLAVTALALVAALAAALSAGCTREPSPVRVSQETLGTIVTISAYAARDRTAEEAASSAFGAMAEVESQLDAHDASSAVAAFNARPYTPQPLPADALQVFRAVDDLGVGEWFSPSLMGVVRLYDFEGGGRVPGAGELAAEVALAASFARRTGSGALNAEDTWAFTEPQTQPQPAPPGLDFGGAAKGLALDRAAERLENRGVNAAIVSAGSTTIAFGLKPDGKPWRLGVEDPRDPEKLVATISGVRGLVASTSGDYQRFFERDGVRYHHILDPRTGQPARGLRSLTVVTANSGAAAISALDSDILSTALFVAGRERAEAYAREHDLVLITVDDAGEVRVVESSDSSVRVELADK